MTSLIELWASVAGVAAMLVVIGWPIRTLVFSQRPELARLVPSPVVGLAAVQLVAWWWLDHGGGGLGELRWPMVVSTVVLVSGAVVVRRRRPAPLSRADRRALTVAVSCGVVALVLTSSSMTALWAHHGLTAASLGNNDVASYAAIADFVGHSDFDDAAKVVPSNFGDSARRDVLGAYVVMEATAVVTRGDEVSAAGPAMCLAIALVAASFAGLLARFTKVPAAAAIVLPIIVAGSYLQAYISGQYFLSQVLGMAVIAPMLAIGLTAAACDRWSDLAHLAGLALTLFVVLLLTYPHMAALLPPIVVVPAALTASPRSVLAAARPALVLGLGLLGAVCLLPTRTRIAVERLVLLNGVVAGWPLPGVLPAGLVGFQRSFTDTVSPALVVGSVALIVVATAATVAQVRAGGWQHSWSLAAAITALVAYAAFYFGRGGPTYEQWKWISFAQPVVAIGLLVPIVEVLERRRRRSVALVGLGGLAAVSIAGGTPLSASMADGPVVTPDLRALSDLEQPVNVSLSFWETMWSANLLERTGVTLLSPNYYGVAPPSARETVVRLDDPVVASQGLPARALNSTYGLVPLDSRVATQLAATTRVRLVTSSVAPGSTIQGTYDIDNTGTGWWLGGASLGTVNLGVRLLDPAGNVVVADFGRVPLAPHGAVAPGAKVTGTFSIPAPPSTGTYRVQFVPVSEGVSWFDGVGSAPVSVPLDARG